eukprot:2260012-Pyramimonas_sp.AAC.1
MYNVSEGDVNTWHVNWFRKFRAEVATEAKLVILAKYVAAIGDMPECNFTLEECYRIHPSLFAWPSLTFYGGRLISSILDPLQQRPCAEGLEWPLTQPLSGQEYEAAKSEDASYEPEDSLIDTAGGFRSKAACVAPNGGSVPGYDWH